MTGKLHIGDGLSLPLEAVTQTFAILAKRGVGKTYLGAVLSEELLKAKQQLVVVDPIGVWWGLRASADGKSEGFPIIIFGGEHADVPLEETGGRIAADFVIDTGQSAILDLSLLRKGAQVRFMTDFAEQLYHRNRSAIHVVIDEADAFAPQKPPKGHERLLGAIEDLVRRGRARGIGLTLITQRSAVLNKNVLTQTEVLMTLRTTAPQDTAAIMAWIEHHGEEERAATMLESLPALPIGDVWVWSPGWLDLFKRTHVRERETFDSSRTPKPGEKQREPKALAAVDLAKLSKDMQASVERARADDPKALRARIASLEKGAQQQARAAAQTAPQEAIDRAVAAAMKQWQRGVEDARRDARTVTIALANQAKRMPKIVADLADYVNGLPALVEQLTAALGTTGASNGHRPHVPDVAAAPPSAPYKGRDYEIVGANGERDIGKGESVVLRAIAQSDGNATRQQLTVLTGYKRSTRDTYLQRLGAAGLIEFRGQQIVATQSGIATLGSEYRPLPTGRELYEHYVATLPEGEAKILKVLAESFPDPVDRETLSAETGYARSSRDTYIQRLRARQLIAADRGLVLLADSLGAAG